MCPQLWCCCRYGVKCIAYEIQMPQYRYVWRSKDVYFLCAIPITNNTCGSLRSRKHNWVYLIAR